jgi:CRP/FNR family transcriptional regulator
MGNVNEKQSCADGLGLRERDITFGSARVAGSLRRLEADEGLFLEGEPALRVFKVVRGLVRCFQMTEDGRRHICRFAGPGDVIGLSAADRYRYSSEAVGPTVVVSASRSAVDSHTDPKVREYAWLELVKKLAHSERLQLRLSRLTAEERVADFLTEILEKSPEDVQAIHRILMSRLDIADYLGLTLETVSRGLHRLNWLGVIELIDAHHFRVRQLNGLRRIAGGDRDKDVDRAA